MTCIDNKALWCAALASLMAFGALAAAPARAADGSGTFLSECAECHSASQGKNKKGPSLFGVAGRAAGSLSDYSNYSDAIKHSQMTWNDQTLRKYLSQPSSTALPGTKMKYEGLDDPKELDALIAYLNTLH